MTRIQQFTATLRAFVRSKRGNVAMLFALSMVPLTLAAGVGLDYARAMLVRQQMSEALDAAALAVGSSTNLDHDTAQALAQKYFNANYTVSSTAFGSPTITIPATGYNSSGSVVINATNNMPTILVKLAGFNTLPVTASSTVVWGQSKLWVALALDNSGSMAQGDSSGSKMDALKNASKSLLTTLQAAATNQGDVQVAIVPFANLIKPNLSGTTYIDFREFNAQPPLGTGYMTTTATVNGISFRAWGPGDDCPFDGSDGYICSGSPTNNSSCSPSIGSWWRSNCPSTIPSSGTYTGYICPSMSGGTNDGRNSRFYNGCYTSTKNGSNTVQVSSGSSATCNGFSSSNCSCSGSGSGRKCNTQRWNHTWVTNATSTWGGCVMDRQRNGVATYGASAATSDYDTSNTTPSSGDTLYPAVNYSNCLTATVTPFPSTWTAAQWTTLATKIDDMDPGGSTNQAIGVEHAWQVLTPGNPYGTVAVPANTSRYIILFSDGLNTQDRWYGDGSTENTTEDGYIDTRTASACTKAKADGIIIYAIFVHIGTSGSSSTLSNCASDSTKFFDLTSTSGVVSTFNQIAQQITNVRVSK